MVMAEDKIIFEDELYKEDNCPLLEECIFWGDNDSRWGDRQDTFLDFQVGMPGIDLNNDSYIWCFSGPRGAGKTSYMSYLAEQAAYLYDKRIISNYPMKYKIRYLDGTVKLFKSEPLDIGKLLRFDEDYQGAIFLIDEAPQVVNRLATMTWKNRLLDLWIEQIRKNHNSLFYATQFEFLVDKELRWQTDIIARCREISRRYPKSGHEKGSQVLVDLLDWSGQWTGYSYEERPRVVSKRRILTQLIWNSFDTYHKIDVFESLSKVQMQTGIIQVGKEKEPDMSYIDFVIPIADQGIKEGRINSSDFYALSGITDDQDSNKKHIGRCLTKAGIERTGFRKAVFDFSNFNRDKFIEELYKLKLK